MAEILTSAMVERVKVLTINRPQMRNALNGDLVRLLLDAISSANIDENVSALILTGTAPVFCAGGDLSDLPEYSDAADLAIRHRHFVELARRITTSHKPVIAAVNGPAVGAGVSLALACDYIVMSDTAMLKLSFLSVGLPPDLLSVSLLCRRAGSTVAADLLYSAQPVDARDAVRLHLVDEQCGPDAIMPTAIASARRLGALPSFAFATTKTLLRHATTLGDALVDFEPFAVGAAAASREFIDATARYRR